MVEARRHGPVVPGTDGESVAEVEGLVPVETPDVRPWGPDSDSSPSVYPTPGVSSLDPDPSLHFPHSTQTPSVDYSPSSPSLRSKNPIRVLTPDDIPESDINPGVLPVRRGRRLG